MKINIKKIIRDTKNETKNEKIKNKNYFIIDKIIKKSIIFFILNDKNISKHYNFSFGN